MATQHAWVLLTTEIHAQLASEIVQPTGEMVGDQPVSVGGFTLIGSITGWNMVIGIGLTPVFDAMLTQIGQINAQSPQPVGLLLARVDDDAERNPDMSQLDVAMDAAQLAGVNWWLSSNGFATIAGGTLAEVIVRVGGCFRGGFTIGQDMVM